MSHRILHQSSRRVATDTTLTHIRQCICCIRLCLFISDFGVAKGSASITIDRTIALSWEGQEKKI